MADSVEVSLHDGVLSIRLDRPDKRNALTNAMYGAMADALQRAAVEEAVRCVLITGSGGVFTAGNDLGDFVRIASGELKRADLQVGRFLDALVRLDRPVVAAVEGTAVGVGTTLLLHCDLVYLSETAILSAPFVDLALVPEAASSLLLPARIGHARAFAMFALGESLSAAEALALGLANRVLGVAELLPHAQAAARALAAKAPEAVRATKRLMRDRDVIAARLAVESEVFHRQLASDEARAAFAAFAARRSAVGQRPSEAAGEHSHPEARP